MVVRVCLYFSVEGVSREVGEREGRNGCYG